MAMGLEVEGGCHFSVEICVVVAPMAWTM
jgi:hypothetical protein